MKISHLSLAVPAALMILGGCSKGATNNGEIEHKSERITVTLPASCPIRWQAGEQITIIGSSSNTFSILPGFSETEASFEGQTIGGYSFKIIHPGTITSITGLNANAMHKWCIYTSVSGNTGISESYYATDFNDYTQNISTVNGVSQTYYTWDEDFTGQGDFPEDILGTDREADGYIYPESCQQ